MQTSLAELQKVLYSRLSNDNTLSNIITGVHDYVSGDAVFPYITIGEPTVTGNMTKTSVGENIVLPLHTWSDYDGKKETYELFNYILSALHEPLKIGGSFLMLRRDLVNMRAFFDPGGAVHGVMEIRYYINN
ncbi:DUF3168 domain-containing protein [Virgibacillus siamensis]|uniref:DUF3168 domain-containing protein n=1 Tax=Virgibacillus siamensis TaxID=480071 RepID=UPI000986474D|nr:DUF3168 domain-containing protein [Virgibacillus siamensis]